ncbi:MAG: F0F1 ATP synthase subunit C [Arsenophonus sp. NEOnobi-MAG3]
MDAAIDIAILNGKTFRRCCSSANLIPPLRTQFFIIMALVNPISMITVGFRLNLIFAVA